MSDISKSEKNKRLLLVILVLITLTAVGVSIWALLFRNSNNSVTEGNSDSETKILTPDYAPKELEKNAKPIGDDNDEKLPQAKGGGAVSLTYSKEVSIDLTAKKCSLLFGNPTRSNQDMVVQIVVQDTIIIQSGRVQPGNQVTSLDLENGAESLLEAGGYEGKFVVLYYQQDTGEKAIVNTEIPITITVSE